MEINPRPQETPWTTPLDEDDQHATYGQPFATVPYTVHLNDIASFDFPGFNRPPASSS